MATGLLWAPCAGPILGLVLTGAAISGPNARTTLLLFAYAAGAATSLAIAILAGGRVFALLKKSLGAGEWVRRALGVAVLLAVVAIVFGWDSSVLTRLSLSGTNRLEQSLIDGIKPAAAPPSAGATMAMSNSMAGGSTMMRAGKPSEGLPIEGEIPSLSGATSWLNSPPLTAQGLRGKVVLVDFWTYSCINCLRALPYVTGWYEKYKDHGLVVIGVHAPEFAFEKDAGNVRRAVADLHIAYPVALDNNFAIWQAFNNQYWPAHYFIDSQGHIRAHHFGEGSYDESETIIRQLLTEAGYTRFAAGGNRVRARPACRRPPDEAHDQSPETYVGYRRAENFASPGGFAQDRPKLYSRAGFVDAESMGAGRDPGRWTRESGTGRGAGKDRIPLFCPRSAPGRGARRRRQAGAVPGTVGRRGARGKSRSGYRCRRPGRHPRSSACTS